MIVAKTKKEFIELATKKAFAIIDSENAKEILLEKFSDKLTSEDIDAFLSDCKFNMGIICHLRYDKIKKLLNEKDFYNFIGHFGFSRKFFKDYKNYWCQPNGERENCATYLNYICSSWCGHN
jgi:hypothetical protein